MPTLKQLCEQNELPFKIRRDDWEKDQFFVVIASNEFNAIGFRMNGEGCTYMFTQIAHWHLYTEPKPKKKYTPYLISRGGSNILEIQYYSEDANIVPDRRHPSLPDIEIENE
jgi:hypothetical protein